MKQALVRRWPIVTEHSAAQVWLGENYEQVINDADEQWFEDVKERWEERYEHAQSGRKKLAELNNRGPADLNDDELWERLILSEQFADRDVTLRAIDDYENRLPVDPDATFVHGRLLYEAKDALCLQYFEKSQPGRRVGVDACEYAYQFLRQRGQSDEARQW